MTTSRPRFAAFWRRHRLRLAALALAGAAWPLAAQAPPPDICGCRNHPGSLGAFDTRDQATWPPGTTLAGSTLTIPLPADGVLVFDSVRVAGVGTGGTTCCLTVVFGRNAANTPVTLLVKGDVTITSLGAFSVRGDNGVGGSFDAPGRGGLGGPGGFRGGDGAYQMVNLANNGGAGLGPGGGSPGIGTTAPPTAGGNATFLASPDLLPLVGGSGGGGGASTSASAGCSGGGGGGGGGAILIAANGTITIDGSIIAEGGDRGFNASSTCASAGGGGSGGALRLVASSITGTGSLLARGGVNASGVRASPGSIRIEALSNSFPMVSNADPDAVGSLPGPIVNPLTPTVAITAVGGQPVPQPPQGGYGAIDVQIPAPGPTAIDLRTSGVPAGTTVEVKVKPRVGGTPATGQATLGSCDAAGVCQGSVTFDLPAGSYVIEARATFQTG